MKPKPPPAVVGLADLLFREGFGSRAECLALVRQGRVQLDGQAVTDAEHPVPRDGLVFQVDGQPWQAHAQALVLLHKPPGHECSQKPSAWPSVLGLLPAALRRRGLQPVGRLDQDTTGLLLLTDDGALLHRLTSPRHHVLKVYRARTARPLTPAQCQALRDGVMLRGEARPAQAPSARALDDRTLEMSLDEGRYHQVKRMIAAVGNHCEALHRSRFGPLDLGDLPQAAWRWATAQEWAALCAPAGTPGKASG